MEPVTRMNHSFPSRARISSHCAPARWSFYGIGKRGTVPAPSNGTRPCIWPAKLAAATDSPPIPDFDGALRILPQEAVLYIKILQIGFHSWILGHTGSVILQLRRLSVQPIFFTWLFSNCLYLSSNKPAIATFSLIGRRTLCLSLTTKLSAACS